VSDPRTLDNPNDIAIREEQKRHRLEQGRALLVKAEADKHVPPKEYSESFTFRFRQIKNGSFAGLWELCAMRGNGKVDELIMDADSLPNVLESIGNIFANRGF